MKRIAVPLGVRSCIFGALGLYVFYGLIYRPIKVAIEYKVWGEIENIYVGGGVLILFIILRSILRTVFILRLARRLVKQ